ncbi:hypothetical protein DOY81_006576 [Sarcophaga bullata]|nr:hypothetical protein DOY81_006576 [Sarcophaga bullata]
MSLFDADWSLKFKIPANENLTFMIYLKHPRNLLNLKDFPNFVWRYKKRNFRYLYNIVHHYAESNVKDLRRSQRKCLFNDESFPFEELRNASKTNFYNQDYCLHYCQAKEFVKRCQCLPHTFDKIFYPILANKYNESKLCGLDDLLCYEEHFLKIRQLECAHCLNNCNYTDYISSQKLENDAQFINSSVEEYYQEVSIDLEYWPLLQFRTVIIFSTIEYLLSLVSVASLFLGTSFLTLIEAFYGLSMRYGCSYYVNWNNLQKEIKKQDELERLKPLPCINMSLKPFWKK